MAEAEGEAVAASAAQSQKQLQHKSQGKSHGGRQGAALAVVGVAKQPRAQNQTHSINNLHKKRPEKLQWPAKCQCAVLM